MYIHILKRDLKNKKTMNTILLLFMILATMFISSSINNIAAVSYGLDRFFEKAGILDYFLVTSAVGGQQDNVPQILEQLDTVIDYKAEPFYSLDSSASMFHGEKLDTQGVNICSVSDTYLTFYDEDNQRIEKVPEGEVYLHRKVMTANDLEKGDRISITVGDTTLKLTVAGYIKDASLGSDLMGVARYLMNQKDFDRLASEEGMENLKGCMYYVETKDVAALEKALSESDNNIMFMSDRALLEKTYVLDMAVAGALLVISLFLIVIAFLVVRFTIGLTIEEEYREIGVMKAIGIDSLCIRTLYLIKYFAISVVGVVIGFFLSIPLGNQMLAMVSKSVVLENEHVYGINFGCALFVVAITLLFCFGCTRRVSRFTPMDALRSGSSGERFRKYRILKLSRSHLGTAGFLGANDILSSLRRYLILTITFTLTFTLILVMADTVSTLSGNQLLRYFSMTVSDIYLEDYSNEKEFVCEDGKEKKEEQMKKIEKLLKEHDMPASLCVENCSRFSLVNGKNICKSLTFQGIGTCTDQYDYIKGTPPENEDEIAMTALVAKRLHADIGDRVVIQHDEGDKEYLITALYQSMNNNGEGVRFHEDAEFSYARTVGFFACQITFTDHPDKKEIKKRAEKIQELFPSAEIFIGGEYAEDMTGGTTQMVDSIRILSVAVGLFICILVAVLMERAFIAQEKGEIAMLKAIGFSDQSIVNWHTCRIFVVLLFSVLLGILISTPAAKLSTGQVFRSLGAEFIEFEIRPLQVYVLYPLLVIGSTLSAVYLTACYTRKITPADMAANE